MKKFIDNPDEISIPCLMKYEMNMACKNECCLYCKLNSCHMF